MVKFLFLFKLTKSQILNQISWCEERTLKIFKIFQGEAVVLEVEREKEFTSTFLKIGVWSLTKYTYFKKHVSVWTLTKYMLFQKCVSLSNIFRKQRIKYPMARVTVYFITLKVLKDWKHTT